MKLSPCGLFMRSPGYLTDLAALVLSQMFVSRPDDISNLSTFSTFSKNFTTTGLVGLADRYPLYPLGDGHGDPAGELAFDFPKLGLKFCKFVNIFGIKTELRVLIYKVFFGVVLISLSELFPSDYNGDNLFELICV